MILIDTSVWIDHLRRRVPLIALLENKEVASHPFVTGELACGGLQNRNEIMTLLQKLPQLPVAVHREVMLLVERDRLWGRGVGWIDVHLLASALISGAKLWTLDRALATIAASHDALAFPVP